MPLSRRNFLKTATGLMLPLAVGLVPDEEDLRRFWSLGVIPHEDHAGVDFTRLANKRMLELKLQTERFIIYGELPPPGVEGYG